MFYTKLNYVIKITVLKKKNFVSFRQIVNFWLIVIFHLMLFYLREFLLAYKIVKNYKKTIEFVASFESMPKL